MTSADMNNRAKHHEPRDEAWGPCPDGELQGMVRRLDARDQNRRNAVVAKAAGTVAVGVVLLAIGVGLIRGGVAAPGGMMTCEECVANFDALNQHLTEQVAMDEVAYQRTWEHMQACGKCQRYFGQLHPGVLEQTDIVLLTLASPPALNLAMLAASTF